MAPVLNMSRPEVGQGCEYTREIQDAEYAWINLSVPKECATMHEYALIMLNMLEPACIYLNKQKSEHTRILNASDVVHSLRSLYKLLSSYRDKAPYLVFRNCQTFKMESFVKRNDVRKCKSGSVQPEMFQGRRVFAELGHFDKDFVNNTRQKGKPIWAFS